MNCDECVIAFGAVIVKLALKSCWIFFGVFVGFGMFFLGAHRSFDN
jgi:hypothetical protein